MRILLLGAAGFIGTELLAALAARGWFLLGWPAFIALAIVFWLMIARPS